MKKIILNISLIFSICLLIVCLYFSYSSFVLKKTFGPTTEKQLKQAFGDVIQNKYETIILGSSLMYRGVTPEKITFSGSCYNFAHDNDSYNQMFYKLKFLLDNGRKPKNLIISVDYFNFSRLTSSRNLYYFKYFDEKYKNDYLNDITSTGFNAVGDFVNDEFETFMNQKFEFSLIPTIKGSLKLLKGNVTPERFLKQNGQLVLNYKEANDTDVIGKQASYQPRKIQIHYFERILLYAKEYNINVFLVFPPIRKYMLDYPEEETKFLLKEKWSQETLNNNNIYMLDYSSDNNFVQEDYQDYIHLNVKGADKFSSKLNYDIFNLNMSQ